MVRDRIKQFVVAWVIAGVAIAAAVYFAADVTEELRLNSAKTVSSEIERPRAEAVKLYSGGEYKKAVPLLKQQLKDEAGDTQSRSLLASAYWRAGDFENSYKQYRRLLKDNPNNGETLYLLSLLAKQLDRPKQALAYMEKAAAAQSDSVLFQVRLARLCQEQQQYEQAVAIWEKLLDTVPEEELDRPDVYAELAGVHMAVGDQSQAQSAIDQGLAIQADHAGLLALRTKLMEQ